MASCGCGEDVELDSEVLSDGRRSSGGRVSQSLGMKWWI